MKDDENRLAVEEAARLMEEGREIPFEIEVGPLLDATECILISGITKNRYGLDADLEERVATKSTSAIPKDLIDSESGEYTGPSDRLVTVAFSYREMERIGREILDTFSGRELLKISPDFPASIRPGLDGRTNQWLSAFLNLEGSFEAAGGKRNIALLAQVGERLS